jgi:hypothetical protein
LLQRIQTGATVAALTLSTASFVWNVSRPAAAILLVVTVLVLVATFANKTPYLHRLPGVGSPTVDVNFNQKPMPGGPPEHIMIEVGLYVSTRLEDATLNFLVPEDINFWNSDYAGNNHGQGRLMLPTNEPLTPGIEWSKYWADKADLRFGAGLSYFVLVVKPPASSTCG